MRPRWLQTPYRAYRSLTGNSPFEQGEWRLIKKFSYFKAWKLAVSIGLSLHYGQKKYFSRCLLESAFDRGMIDTKVVWECFYKAKRYRG